MRIRQICVWAGIAAMTALPAVAREIAWTGAAGPAADGWYHWKEAHNWESDVVPGENDTAVFRPEGTLSVWPDSDGTYFLFSGMRFERGQTCLGNAQYVLYCNAKTTTVYVAEGATASITNRICTWSTSNRLRKTGAGTLHTHYAGKDAALASLEAVEGVWLNDIVRDGNIPFARTKNVWIASGAVFCPGQYDCFLGNVRPDIVVERDATLRLNGRGTYIDIAGLSGEGFVTDTDYRTELRLEPTVDCVFSGSFASTVRVTVKSSAAGRFVVGAADAFAETWLTGSARLAFAPDVSGVFDLGEYQCDESFPLVLEDTNGAPVSASAYLGRSISTFGSSGCGDLLTRGTLTLTGTQVRSTGRLVVESGALTLGNGTAAGDFDASAISSIEARGGTLAFNNSEPFVYSGTVTAEKNVTFSGTVDLHELNAVNQPKLTVRGDVTVRGGDMVLKWQGISFESAGARFELAGGRLYGSLTLDTEVGVTSIPTPNGIIFDPGDNGHFVVSGTGEAWVDSYSGTGVRRIEQTGGVLHRTTRPLYAHPNATAGNPTVILLDGAETRATSKGVYAHDRFDLFADAGEFSVQVGSAGALFSQEDSFDSRYGQSKNLNRPLVTASGLSADGGVSFAGFAEWLVSCPISVNGGVTALGTRLRIPAGSDLTSYYLGTGPLCLEDTELVFSDRTGTPSLSVSSLSFGGGAILRLRESSSGQPVDVSAGALTRKAGGALFLMDSAEALGTSGRSHVRVDGGVAVVSATKRVQVPVFGCKGEGKAGFLTYDDEAGFVDLPGVVSSSAPTSEMEGKVASIRNTWCAVGDDAVHSFDALELTKDTTVSLNGRTSFRLGDGVGPGCLILNGAGLWGSATASLDFGQAEGLVVSAGGNKATGLEGCTGLQGYDNLRVSIRGEGGVSFVGVPSLEACGGVAVLDLMVANGYAGDTYVNALRVTANHSGCFSSGIVHVGGGDRFGGQIQFNVEDGVWTNGFRVSGRGMQRSVYGGDQGEAVFAFCRSGIRLTGNVVIDGHASFRAATDASGEVSGVVSGGRLEIYRSPGTVRLAADNVHTGGTSVVAGTLELVRAHSAGTGCVSLDGGVLRFVNTEPIVFTNDVEGIGTVVLAGAPVTCTSKAFAALPFETFSAGTTLDLTNSANNVYVPVLTGDTDLGGASYALAGLVGTGRISNGTLTVSGEINPAGPSAVGTLAFAPGVLVPGAGLTYVCDVLDDAADCLVFEEDVNLATLDFRAVRNGCPRGRATVLSTSGMLTGAFGSAALPKASWSLECGEQAVVLHFSPGFVLKVR